MAQCRHVRKGIVTTHPPNVERKEGESHAARSVCDRPECIQEAKIWVAGQANRTAYYVRDKKEKTVAGAWQ